MDFAISYKQRRWKMAIESYQRWIKVLNSATNPKAKQMAQNVINSLLKEYPQLAK